MAASWLESAITGFSAMSGWEVIAALLGVGYIIFAARESQWCWPMAFISTLIYSILFWEGQLPSQTLLNVYYMWMAIYGFWLWNNHTDEEDNLPISSWPWLKHLIFISVGTLLSLVSAYYLSHIEASQSPYLESFITVFSVMNTWLMARKILQNWLYWIVIDMAAVVLYWQTGFYATVILFSLYTVLAIAGFISWFKHYQSISQHK